MRFTILNFLMLIVAIAAIIAWRMDKSRFEHVIANYGEYKPASTWDEVSGGDIADVVSIGDVSFVYCYSDIAPNDSVETELKDLGLPSDAEQNGRPNDALFSLINELLVVEHSLSLETVTADAYGNSEFWKITWSLFPAEGGLSGVPYQFIAYVRPDGSAVQPRVYLRDYFGSFYDEQHDRLYSVMSVDKLKPETDVTIDEKKLIEVSTEHLLESLRQLNVKTKFRFDGVKRRTFSPALSRSSDQPQPNLEIWAVDFVDSAIPKGVNNDNSATRITIWTTSDLTTSTLSVGDWKLDE